MNKSFATAVLAAGWLCAGTAAAQTAPPDTPPAVGDKPAPGANPPAAAAPTPAITITGGATLVSDYRFRGLSQTNKNLAVQGTATISHSSGLYASFWGSTIDDYIANGSHEELDLIAGYKKTFSGTTIDGGVLYYVYPANHGANTDFFEPYISASRSYGPLGVKLGGNLAWKQRALSFTGNDRRGGIYGYGELSVAIPKTPLSLTGHVGHSFVKNYITFGTHYTDYSVQATYTYHQLTLGVAFVDTDKNLFSYPPPSGPHQNRNISQAGVVGSFGVAF